MLHLLDTAHWRSADERAELPNTLPGWTIAYLALRGKWVSREHLCALLWPDAASGDALHSLRVNLYRVRALLQTWGQVAALQVERRRVRLDLPSDVARLRQAVSAAHAARAAGGAASWSAGLASYRQPMLAGMSLPGFPALAEWVELERAALQQAWRNAALAQLSAGGLAAERGLQLSQQLLDFDPLDEQALTHHLRTLAELGRTGDARRLLRQFRERLRQALGAEPSPALEALVAQLGRTGPAVAVPVARDAFIGRELELDQLRSMLAAGTGWVTVLVGPAGVGKSRMARELARRLAGQWPDGVAWVSLADVDDAAAIVPRLAEQLGVAPEPGRDAAAQVGQRLRRWAGLVVLDNAEHLPGLWPLLAGWLGMATGVAWLVTSRHSSELPRARSYTLDGLQCATEADDAGAAHDDAARVMALDAVQLLVARVAALDPDSDLAAQWADCLALVQLTGGWPLAIELAAGAVAQQGLGAVLADLRQSIDALAAAHAPPQARHDSMRASLDLSWRALGADEQDALAALSVFRGGFTRQAAQDVTGATGVTLARLTERRLLQVLGQGRFGLHPLVIRYAAERLALDAGRQASARRAHVDQCAARLLACADAPHEDLPALWAALARDFEEVRAAWPGLLAGGDSRRIGRAAAAWSDFGSVRGRARELAAMIGQAMPVVAGDAVARCAVLQAAANLNFRAGDYDAAQALAREAEALATALGDGAAARASLNVLALALKDLGRYAEAERHAADALQRARDAGSEHEVAASANTCAILAKARGDFPAAAALYAEAIARHRRTANHRRLAICLNNLGNVHRAQGDLAAAQATFEECLRTAEQHGIASTRAFALVNLSIVHERAGRLALALSFADRAAADPAAEVGVQLAGDTVRTLVAIREARFAAAQGALQALATRARQTGLHAAQLEAVSCHARLLAAQGRRDEAAARWLYLMAHPQLPAAERDEAAHLLAALAPSAAERRRAQQAAERFDLEILLDGAARPESAPH